MDIQVPFSACTISKRNSGKSFLCKYILYTLLKNKQIDLAVCFSNTNEYSDDWNMLPSKYRIQGFKESELARIIAHQKKQKTLLLEGKKVDLKQVLIIFDDVSGMKDYKKSELVEELYANSRHFNMSIITLIQYSKFITPACRNNLDYLFLGVNTHISLESIYEIVIFDGCKKDFKAFVNQHTKDYFFIMYNNTVRDHAKLWLKVRAKPVSFNIAVRSN